MKRKQIGPYVWRGLWAVCFGGIFVVPVVTGGNWDMLADWARPIPGPAVMVWALFHWLPAVWLDCLYRHYLLNWALMLLLGAVCLFCRKKMGGDLYE